MLSSLLKLLYPRTTKIDDDDFLSKRNVTEGLQFIWLLTSVTSCPLPHRTDFGWPAFFKYRK